MGLITARMCPRRSATASGTTHSSMITAMVTDVVGIRCRMRRTASICEKGDRILLDFRKFMFRAVYMSDNLIPDRDRGSHVVKMLFSITRRGTGRGCYDVFRAQLNASPRATFPVRLSTTSRG